MSGGTWTFGSVFEGGLLLAQQGLVNMEPLSGGSVWEVWLLEKSWLTGGVLVFAGVLAWFFLARAEKKTAAVAVTAALVTLGIAVSVLGNGVETDREHIRARTAEFVDEFVAGQTRSLEELMLEQVVLLSSGAAVNAERDLLISASSVTPISDISYTDMGAEMISPGLGKTRFAVRTTHAGIFSGTVTSGWELEWVRGDDDEWRIGTFQCMHIMNRPPGDQWVTWARRVAR